MKQTILCVDDEIDNVDALERLFRKAFTVLKATSGPEALGLLAKYSDIAVILSDQRMPNMNGIELLEKSIKSHPHTSRILLTGYTDIESVIAAVNYGEIYRYITKPWDPNDLLKTVTEAATKYSLRQEVAIKNEDLAKANKELQSLDQSKNQFMILINHELKTPLTTILNFTSLLKETALSEEQSKYLSRVEQSSERLKVMVEDSLKIVSGETGLIKTNIISHQFSAKALQISGKALTFIKQREQNLRIATDEDVIRCDMQVINEVISRLMENASKFSESKSDILVTGTKSKDNYTFTVSNKGQQIPQDIVERIMKPFSLNEDIMKHSTGLGLGLSVCQALLKSHNSSLQFSFSDGYVHVSFNLA